MKKKSGKTKMHAKTTFPLESTLMSYNNPLEN